MPPGARSSRATSPVRVAGEVARELRAPGGTRKIVYLSGAPGNFIANYKLIRGSLWARIAWAREGHGTQSVQHLLDLSRTVGDIGFVAFVLIFHDILHLTLRPFALAVQATLEPSVLAYTEERLRRRLQLTQPGIRNLRSPLICSPTLLGSGAGEGRGRVPRCGRGDGPGVGGRVARKGAEGAGGRWGGVGGW